MRFVGEQVATEEQEFEMAGMARPTFSGLWGQFCFVSCSWKMRVLKHSLPGFGGFAWHGGDGNACVLKTHPTSS